jgi:hypothetical protein
MAKLFFSYSHKDEVLRDTLQTHLEMLRRSGAIETWHDRMIRAGDELDGAIDQNMEDADVILLLVSSDFLASSYCFDVEVKRAMERHEAGTARVIPVILRPCDWQEDTPFKKLLVAPKDGKPITKWPNEDEAFLDVVKQIRAALKTIPTPPMLPKAASVIPLIIRPYTKDDGMFASRSSNLRLHKTFTQADKDRFMDDAFEFMAKYFEGSLDELKKRHPEIDARFKRIDAESFTAVIYRNGEAVSKCAVRHGGTSAFGNGITYSHDDRSRGNSFNEVLSIVVGEQSLSLKPMGMSSMMRGVDRESGLSSEGAAEFYWGMLMEPLQRR